MIVDASVAFKWFAEEEGSDRALALITNEQLFAPTLLLAEVGNALWKKARRAQIDPDVSFEPDIIGLTAIVSIQSESPYVARALTMARALDHPIYDCIYLAMAEIEGRMLITADRRFLNRAVRSEWNALIMSLT